MVRENETTTQHSGEELLAIGKRHLVCGEITEALSALQESCSSLSSKYGEMTFECADAYFQYGSALLEQARLEDNLLSNAIKGSEQVLGEESDEDSDDDGDEVDGSAEAAAADSFVIPEKLDDGERERITEAVFDAMCTTEVKATAAACGETGAVEKSEKAPENATAEEVTTAKKTEIEPPATSDKSIESNGASAAASTAGTEKEPQGAALIPDAAKEPEPSEGEAEGACAAEDAADAVESEDAPSEDADEVPTLQLAWEMLECAKLLYTRRIAALEGSSSTSSTASGAGTTDEPQKLEDDLRKYKLRVADCHYRLAEIGLEKEDPLQALDDLNTCLQAQLVLVEKDSRVLAETRYLLGVAWNFAYEWKRDIEAERDWKSSAGQLLEGTSGAGPSTSSSSSAANGSENDAAKQQALELAAKLPALPECLMHAVEEFKLAVELVRSRIVRLENERSQLKLINTDDEKTRAEELDRELKELRELLPELNEKVADAEALRFESSQSVEIGSLVNPSSKAEFSATVEKGSSIDHLVRKKRKFEESDEQSSKSARIEGASGCAGQHHESNKGTSSVAPIDHDASANSEHN